MQPHTADTKAGEQTQESRQDKQLDFETLEQNSRYVAERAAILFRFLSTEGLTREQGLKAGRELQKLKDFIDAADFPYNDRSKVDWGTRKNEMIGFDIYTVEKLYANFINPLQALIDRIILGTTVPTAEDQSFAMLKLVANRIKSVMNRTTEMPA